MNTGTNAAAINRILTVRHGHGGCRVCSLRGQEVDLNLGELRDLLCG
jgi:hypothetical protein